MGTVVSSSWILDNYPALKSRVKRYPEQTNYANRLFENALKDLDSLHVEREEREEVCDVIERFRVRLREYKLALTTCTEYCNSLMRDMEADVAVLNDVLSCDRMNGYKEGDDSWKKQFHELLTTLMIELGTLKVIQCSCENHLKVVEDSDKTLKDALAQADLVKLDLIYVQLWAMDDFAKSGSKPE